MSDTPRTDAAYFSKTTLYDMAGEMKKLERELAAANERIKRLEEELELHAHDLSPSMVQARNDQLAAENANLLPRLRRLEKAGDAVAASLGRGLDPCERQECKWLVELPMTDAEYAVFNRTFKAKESNP